MAEVVPLRRSQRLTPQAQIPQNLEVVPLRRSQRLTPQEKIPQNLGCDASRNRKGKAVLKHLTSNTEKMNKTSSKLVPRKKTRSEVVRCCIPVKHIFKSLTLSLRSNQEVEEYKAARCVRNSIKRYLRLQESPLTRRR
ncbi:hypothetical protein MKX03_018035, partial [Papaver bracteatum]